LRKFALLTSVCSLLAFATFARAQQFDLTGGAGTLMSTQNTTASQAYLPPPEKGGTYVNGGFDRIFKNRYGYSAEVAFRAKQALYNNYEQYRPILYDVNAIYAPILERPFLHWIHGLLLSLRLRKSLRQQSLPAAFGWRRELYGLEKIICPA
jgi:hypothetical protein